MGTGTALGNPQSGNSLCTDLQKCSLRKELITCELAAGVFSFLFTWRSCPGQTRYLPRARIRTDLRCALEVVGDGSGGDAADRGCVSVGVGVG